MEEHKKAGKPRFSPFLPVGIIIYVSVIITPCPVGADLHSQMRYRYNLFTVKYRDIGTRCQTGPQQLESMLK